LGSTNKGMIQDKDLNDALSVFEGLNPYASFLENSSLSNVTDFIDTGSLVLNAIVSGSTQKGVPVGRLTQFAGPSQTFKSGFIQQILANAQKKGLKVVIFDTENALTSSGASTLGLDISKVIHIPSTTVEGTRNAIYKFLTWVSERKLEGQFIIAIDSIANLQSEMELTRMDKESVSADMGSFAKSIKSLLKTCINMSTTTKTTIIISNHVHDNPAQMFPSIEANISGGKAAAYLPTVTVQLARKLVADDGGKTVESNLTAGQKKYSGVVIRALTVKNRLIQQYLEGEMYLSFASGLNKYFGLLELMKGLGVVENKGSIYYDWEGNKLGFYKAFRSDRTLWDTKLIPEFDKRIAEEWIYGSDTEIVDDFDDDEEEEVQEELSPLEKLKNLKKKVTETLDEAESTVEG